MKYTPEEIRAEAYDTRLMDYDNTADMLEAMLKAVELFRWRGAENDPPPKDGTTIIAEFDDGPAVVEWGAWEDNHGCWVIAKGPGVEIEEEPTLWMPYPASYLTALAPFDFTTEEEVKP